jgi:hypothetical protein
MLYAKAMHDNNECRFTSDLMASNEFLRGSNELLRGTIGR